MVIEFASEEHAVNYVERQGVVHVTDKSYSSIILILVWTSISAIKSCFINDIDSWNL